MLQSLRLSRLMIRLGLAVVFLWFGIDKFFHPQYWVDAWVPASVIAIFARIGISDINFIYLNGIFELLVATSLLTDLFVRMFSLVAIVFICSIFIFYGFSEVLVRDIGLVGAFLALVFWPERNYL